MMKATNPTMMLRLTPAAMPGAGTNGLRDIKQPVDIPSGWAWVWWVLAALALAALLFWAWRYWQKRRGASPARAGHPAARAGQTEAPGGLGLDRPAPRVLHPGFRCYPALPGRALRFPCARTDHRRVSSRVARDPPADDSPEGEPGGIPAALRPGQVRPLRAWRARTARPARLRPPAGGRDRARR